jgi:hypothetical protein
MKRLLTAGLLALGISWVLPASPAQAASAIQFGRAQYDSPGSDTRTNASINAEYVQIKNLGTAAVTLTGWTVRDAANHVYKFGTYRLAGKQTLTLRTGKGTNSALVRDWGSAAYIWNNPGDKAWIKSAGGTQADYCVWTTTAPGYKNC